MLRSEEDRYKSLERELLQAIKSEIQQRMKKQSNKVRVNIDQPRRHSNFVSCLIDSIRRFHFFLEQLDLWFVIS